MRGKSKGTKIHLYLKGVPLPYLQGFEPIFRKKLQKSKGTKKDLFINQKDNN